MQALPADRSEAGSAVNATNVVGLVLAILMTIFLVIALLFPEKF